MRFAFCLIVATVIVGACSDPTETKPKAAVGEQTKAAAVSGNDAANRLAINPADSKIGFVGSKVTGSHTGGFRSFSGHVDRGAASLQDSRVHIEIDMTSVWSDDDRLTTHLKSGDFFDVASYPKAIFSSTGLATSDDPSTMTLTGNLEFHGVTKSISFPAAISERDGDVFATSEFVLNRKDFGITYGGMADDLIREDVLITLSIRADGP